MFFLLKKIKKENKMKLSKKSIKKSVVTGASWLSGWHVMKGGVKGVRSMHSAIWSKVFHKPEVKFKNDTFKKACLRHGIGNDGERTLDEVKAQFLARKRLNWVLAVLCLGVWVTGLASLRLNMILMGNLALIYASLQVFNYGFRLWQCEREELAGVDDFWADNGLFYLLKF